MHIDREEILYYNNRKFTQKRVIPMNNRIFSPARLSLPAYAPQDPAWTKWAVIACDQFTSEPQYWAEAERIADGAPSALDLMLPEAYLGTE